MITKYWKNKHLIPAALAASLMAGQLAADEGETLVELGPRVEAARAEAGETARVDPRLHDYRWALRLRPADDGSDTRLTFRAPEGGWDLSARDSVEIRLTNRGDEAVEVWGQVANAGGEDYRDQTRNAVSISPGATDTLRVRIVRRPEDPGWEVFDPFIMYFRDINVRDNTVDPAEIDHVALWLERPGSEAAVLVRDIRVTGDGEPAPVPFFPFVDEYGQYMHSQWPGKVYSDEDLADRVSEERAEMREWPGPSDWNEYGGWADGPELEGTGFFRVEKHEGKWWLVDPSGRLFWSHGPTGVGFGGGMTPVTDREHWFRTLPDEDGELGRFYQEGSGARYRYYQERDWTGFGFAGANLLRKYGEDYEEVIADISHDRLRSWGFNTIAAWSSGEVMERRRTPYTTIIHYGGPWMHYRLPDVFHDDWAKVVRERIEAERETTAKDPWNIGYFVDNELGWLWRPRAAHVGQVAIQRDSETGSKVRFVELLEEKYTDIDALNEAWGRDHESWEDLLDSTEEPDMDREAVVEDCGDFGMLYAETYFSHIREVLDEVAPNHLYLGVRFHGHIDSALVALSSEYTDVVSYNIYDNPPDGRANQYRDLDQPIIIGEYSAGNNVVQTPFRYEGQPSPDPGHRSELLERYLNSAFVHPNIVGAHFFQFRDQPLTGRADGEAGTRGFINATDTPHFDIIQTNRRLAYELYRKRGE